MTSILITRRPHIGLFAVILLFPEAALAQQSVTPHLASDLSPMAMFLQADIVVKAVIVSLLLASVVTWTILFAKTIELRFARTRVRGVIAELSRMTSLSSACERLETKFRVGRAFVESAMEEVRLSELAPDKEGVKERVRSRLSRLELAAGRSVSRGTGLLATIGAIAPFVGLFGTVWGIMNSFVGIAKSQTTNLAIVAPGIAEALLATAIGLVAAIPAVVIYNHFSRGIAAYRALVGDASEEVMRMTSRDLDRVSGRPSQISRTTHVR
ncbi:MAG: tonB-system energizer ExbB [Beijerinckiaceae bacterium]|nr:tonB-system energizer ExbB [Beijerinckiaceae bacterium]